MPHRLSDWVEKRLVGFFVHFGKRRLPLFNSKHYVSEVKPKPAWLERNEKVETGQHVCTVSSVYCAASSLQCAWSTVTCTMQHLPIALLHSLKSLFFPMQLSHALVRQCIHATGALPWVAPSTLTTRTTEPEEIWATRKAKESKSKSGTRSWWHCKMCQKKQSQAAMSGRPILRQPSRHSKRL